MCRVYAFGACCLYRGEQSLPIGMIAEHESVNMSAAFSLIRTFARNNNLPLTEAAGSLVDGTLSIDTLRRSSQKRRG